MLLYHLKYRFLVAILNKTQGKRARGAFRFCFSRTGRISTIFISFEIGNNFAFIVFFFDIESDASCVLTSEISRKDWPKGALQIPRDSLWATAIVGIINVPGFDGPSINSDGLKASSGFIFNLHSDNTYIIPNDFFGLFYELLEIGYWRLPYKMAPTQLECNSESQRAYLIIERNTREA